MPGLRPLLACPDKSQALEVLVLTARAPSVALKTALHVVTALYFIVLLVLFFATTDRYLRVDYRLAGHVGHPRS